MAPHALLYVVNRDAGYADLPKTLLHQVTFGKPKVIFLEKIVILRYSLI